MEIIQKVLVWIVNFILSGRAKAVGVAFLGAGVSYLLFQGASLFLNTFITLSPQFQEYVFNHRVWFMIGLFALYMAPVSIGCYMCYNELEYIDNKQMYR
ncbi:hypothetical protein [Acinetobacter sp. 1000160]|uniref:hypothetical protein n=1 Tax=Acinetobacter sp. 1000160 TaxID=1310800 RepID=UPI0005194ABA|nr:hypothetical protein [Acinetobacter sp. 1000160]